MFPHRTTLLDPTVYIRAMWANVLGARYTSTYMFQTHLLTTLVLSQKDSMDGHPDEGP